MNIDRVLSAIREHKMIEKDDDVMVCVSGGADSMALLSFFIRTKETLGIRSLYACHFNHGLRGAESDADEQLVRDYCARCGIRLVVGQGNMRANPYPKGESTESYARQLRYAFFAEAAQNPDTKIAVAHNKEDLAETVLFRLARGTGLKGIRGILPVRQNIIRPFLSVARAEIEVYCAENGIPFALDRTNDDEGYARNRIRKNVLTQLGEINENAVENIGRFAGQADEAWRFIEKNARVLLSQSQCDGGYDTTILSAADRILQKTAIQLLLEEQDIPLSGERINRIADALNRPYYRQQLTGCRFVEIDGGALRLAENAEIETIAVAPTRFEEQGTVFCSLYLHGDRVKQEQLAEVLQNRTKDFDNLIDCGKIKGNLVIRPRQEGDLFHSAVRKQTKSLKKLFNELKIPAEQRRTLPVLCDDEGIVWVAQAGIAERVSIDRGTVEALRIQYEKRA